MIRTEQHSFLCLMIYVGCDRVDFKDDFHAVVEMSVTTNNSPSKDFTNRNISVYGYKLFDFYNSNSFRYKNNNNFTVEWE